LVNDFRLANRKSRRAAAGRLLPLIAINVAFCVGLTALAAWASPPAGDAPASGASPTAPRPPLSRNSPKPEAAARLWYVPMPLRIATLDGKAPPFAEAPNGFPLNPRLVDGGPALDLVWTPERVFLWDRPDVAREVFNKKMVVTKLAVKRPEQFVISGVQWDSKRAWVAYSLQIHGDNGLFEFPSGLAIIEADGKPIQWVGPDDGLPPGEHGLLLHPISAGRVVAVGAFGENDRAWCAEVEPGEAGQRPKVKVFHTADKVVPPPPVNVDGPPDPDPDAKTVFRPVWMAECRPTPAGGGPAPRLLLVGREPPGFRWPLVINLDTLQVSVPATALGQDGFFHEMEACAASADTLLEIHDSSLYRWALTWDGSQLSGKPSPVLEGLTFSPAFAKQLQAVGDCAYIAMARGSSEYSWMRYDLKSQQSERFEPDVLPRLGGVCGEYGVSTRFGLIGLGRQVCRLVAAPQRPPEALRRKLKITPRGTAAWFEAENPAAPAAPALPPAPAKPNRPAPTLDDLIAELKPDNRGLATVAAQLAELDPSDFPPDKRAQVSAALVPLLTSARVMVYTPALKAFAVWHAPEAVAALLPFVNDHNDLVRATAMEALGICRDPRVIPDVAARLPRDIDAALGCLVAMGPASEPALLESIHPSMHPVHERMTIDALALIGTKNSIPPLQSLLEKNPDLETAEIIKAAMEMIEKREK